MNWQKFSNEKKFSRFSGKDAHPCFIPFLKRLGKGFPCFLRYSRKKTLHQRWEECRFWASQLERSYCELKVKYLHTFYPLNLFIWNLKKHQLYSTCKIFFKSLIISYCYINILVREFILVRISFVHENFAPSFCVTIMESLF